MSRTYLRAVASTTALIALFTASCGDGEASGGSEPSVLVAAQEVCGPKMQQLLRDEHAADEATVKDFSWIADGGSTLTVGSPEGSIAAMWSVQNMMCLLDATKAPQSVVSQIEQTTALMGRQKANWESIRLSWSYHPDTGVSAVFEED